VGSSPRASGDEGHGSCGPQTAVEGRPDVHAHILAEPRTAPDCFQRPLLRRSRFQQQVSASVRLLIRAIRKGQTVPQAILFDLDETLTDRTHSIFQYAERLRDDFTDHLVSTDVATIVDALLHAEVRGYRPREEIWRDFSQRLPWRTVPHVSHLRRHWETGFPRAIAARPGLKETLSALHVAGIRLGIVTNGEVLFQAPKITHLAIDRYLSTVVISEAVEAQKPDPRIFAHALAKIGCRAADTWFVGDDLINDVLGAAAVGMRAIWLPGGLPWPTDCPEPQWQIAALRELVELVHNEHKHAT
jgi:putative hydrolase of the HAD superfamily